MASFYSSSSEGGDSSDDGRPPSSTTSTMFPAQNTRQEIDFSFQNMDVESLTLHLHQNWLQPTPTARTSDQKDTLGDDESDHESATHHGSHATHTTEPIINKSVVTVKLVGNSVDSMPPVLSQFHALRNLDLSGNRVSILSDKVLRNLKTLVRLNLKNNSLSDASFDSASMLPPKLKELNLSGNFLTKIPPAVFELSEMKYLYVGKNMISWIPPSIKKLKNLVVLYLGGNELRQVPEEIGDLVGLQALVLCDNAIASIPWTVCKLKSLSSLLLHNNQLQTLPREILKLQMLSELSLRDNPLVLRFVRDMSYDPPSLLELAARVVKVNKIPYTDQDLAWNLREYLSTARRCVNPKCAGVYFDTRVENIKFVDFCGKYRIPLLEFLCSTNCTKQDWRYRRPRAASSGESEDEATVSTINRMKKVLLG